VLLIIGLDGATWDVAEPLIAAGRMPNLAALRARGTWGPLASTTPPATFPSWSTFATGVNPGRHGIFDFTRRVFGTYDVTFINSTFRDAPSLWRRFSDAGKRVGVLGLPGTYPPERLNGCMISGFDTPVTTRADASFIDPPELISIVREEGGFPFADFQEFRIDAEWYRMARERLLRGIETKTRLATRLLRSERWDCFLLLFGESDTVAHHFWKFHDPTSPRFEAANAETTDAVNTVYERLDAAVGELMQAAEPDHTLVVSDHGFGGAGRKCLYLNRWLTEQGFQKRRQSAGGGLSSGLKRLALQMVPSGLQARAFRMNGGRWASRLESRSRFAGIEWKERGRSPRS
jgi:predicted AlkP superfamily phosphohydrolase/phosphomutase